MLKVCNYLQISPFPAVASFKDLTGQRFQRLLVVSYWGQRDHRSRWNCVCDCGREVYCVKALDLKNGVSGSCGCKTSERMKSRGFDLTGQVFGQLTALRRDGHIQGEPAWVCLCSCGNTNYRTRAGMLLQNPSGDHRSCGCVIREVTRVRSLVHGECIDGGPSAEYMAFKNAIARCTDPKNLSYQYYGGRGIEVRFHSLEEFIAEVGRRPTPQHSIDRIDVNGHYEKGNLRWATRREQANNKRNSRSRQEVV